MGKQKQGKKKDKQQVSKGDKADNGHELEPVVRLIALHGKLVAVAVGTSFRVLDWSTGEQVCSSDEHTQPIRAMAFSSDGALLLTAGDDKQVKLWDTATWQCIKTHRSVKKTSAAALTNDNRHVIYADKFGDVCIGTTDKGQQPTSDQQQQEQQVEDPAPLLGHLQAIVTSVTVLPGDALVVTTDRDAKVRVSILQPQQPLLGSYQIQSYCLGHKEFVSCAAVVPPAAAGAAASDAGPAGGALLLTGGGDSYVKLWDPVSGQLLSSYAAVTEEQAAAAQAAADAAVDAAEVNQEAVGDGDGSGGEEEDEEAEDEGAQGVEEEAAGEEAGQRLPGSKLRKALLPVVTLALAPSAGLAAVVVEGQREVQLVKVDRESRALGPCLQRLAIPEDCLAPCRAAFDGEGRLWLVGGPPAQMAKSAHVAVARPGSDGGVPFAFATSDVLPDAARVLLERRDPVEEAVAAEAAAAGLSYTLQLRRRLYDPKEVEQRKSIRTDKWETDRLERMRQRQAEAEPQGVRGAQDQPAA